MKQQPLEKIIGIIILATVLCNGSLWGQEGLRYLDRSLPCLERNFNLQVIMPVDSLSGEPLVSQSEINNVLVQSSSYFEPICLSFTSCSFNQINNYGFNAIENFSRVEEMGALYSFPRRITVLFVNEIDGDDCGFSYYDGFQTTDEAQIFIETPYRNTRTFKILLSKLKGHIKLCVATDLTGESEYLTTLTIDNWKRERLEIPKLPTIFILGT